MLCKDPFVRTPTGFVKLHTILSREAKLAAIPLPCGQCLFCRINKHREMKHRILLEQMAHKESCFLTLTYDDKNLERNKGELNPVDLQKFWKKLRHSERIPYVRYFAVGEYGDLSSRPHYHAAMFGCSPDLEPVFRTIWGMGHTHTGTLCKDSASYIAGYTVKKLTRKNDSRLGGKHPEFFRGSKGGGCIGTSGIKKIAKNLKDDSRCSIKKALTEINYGKYSMPLGRLMAEKLAKELGLECSLMDIKEDHIDETMLKAINKEGVYKDNIVGERKVRRQQITKRRKIYKKERSKI